ncbi:MAG: hypothetical protein ACRCX7_11315 [Cetobacterium sp.]|uniref:hypothetical protein n=1 Tax=Cetobacterium sp. TaxID=2071632 RepID=UPI003F3E2E11
MKKYRYETITGLTVEDLVDSVNAMVNIGRNCRLVSVIHRSGNFCKGVLEFELI